MLRNATNSVGKVAYSVEELSLATSLSKAYIRNQIREGKLVAKKVGKRVLVMRADADAYFNSMASMNSSHQE